MPKGEYCQVAVMAGEAIIAEFYTPLGVKKEFRNWRDQRATLEKDYVSWRKTREWQERLYPNRHWESAFLLEKFIAELLNAGWEFCANQPISYNAYLIFRRQSE